MAYLNKAGQSSLNSWVYSGIGTGVFASVLVGVLFGWTIQALEVSDQPYAPALKPLLEGVFGLIAIALLSWMLVWMTRQAKSLKGQVETEISSALKADSGAGWGVFWLIFIAVLREGFETVIFIAAKFQQGWIPALGAVAGLLTATAIGVLLFKWGVKINLRVFFQVMGVFLLLIVSGLVISALAHFDKGFAKLAQLDPQYAAICVSQASCFLGSLVWNLHGVLPDRQFPGIILYTLFGYVDRLYWVEAIAYVVFLTTVGSIYLQSLTGWTMLSANRKPAEN
ncbi:MAG: FTR1 family iron permease, partial [Phormidesmis sp. CAN_BIN36]|nr:FTR1 family iron permease [Phormidesmis sp. CAN_BIN36]